MKELLLFGLENGADTAIILHMVLTFLEGLPPPAKKIREKSFHSAYRKKSEHVAQAMCMQTLIELLEEGRGQDLIEHNRPQADKDHNIFTYLLAAMSNKSSTAPQYTTSPEGFILSKAMYYDAYAVGPCTSRVCWAAILLAKAFENTPNTSVLIHIIPEYDHTILEIKVKDQSFFYDPFGNPEIGYSPHELQFILDRVQPFPLMQNKGSVTEYRLKDGQTILAVDASFYPKLTQMRSRAPALPEGDLTLPAMEEIMLATNLKGLNIGMEMEVMRTTIGQAVLCAREKYNDRFKRHQPLTHRPSHISWDETTSGIPTNCVALFLHHVPPNTIYSVRGQAVYDTSTSPREEHPSFTKEKEFQVSILMQDRCRMDRHEIVASAE